MNSVNKIDKQNVEDILSLTSMQEGMLYHYINNSGNSEYLVQLSLTISGNIIVDFVKKAWDFVVEANEMLRTVYRWQKLNNPLQVVLKKYNIPFNEIDISKESENEKQAALERIREQCRIENIDISTESIKVTLCKLNSDQYEMIVTNHHIIFDGWSNGIILKDFMYAYNCYYHGDKPVLQAKNKFKEYIKWHKSLDKEAQKLYWGEYLYGFENKSSLFQSINTVNKNIKSYGFKVSNEIREQVVEFSKKNKISVAALFYSIWGILLQKYSGEDDTVFGTTVSGRNAKIKGIEDMVGLFINTLPLRVINQTDDIIDILSKVEKDLIERQEYESAALTDIKSYAYDNSSVELFDSIVVVENYPLDVEQYKNNILQIDSYKSFDLTNYDMTVSITTFDDIEICFYYNQNVLTEDSIKSLSSHFNNILYSIVNKQVKKVSQLELLNEEEKHKLLYEFNDNYTDYPREKTIQELFEEQVERTPDNIAVVFENEKLTYKDLNERANRLARTLREKGVKSDNIIGIMVEKSLEMIVGVLAILKAGGAYLSIDPDYPEDRVKYMLEDSKTKLLLTQKHLLGRVSFEGELLDLLENTIYVQNGDNLEKINSSKDLAYVIYTSGSTGRPKGVMIEHKGLSNLAVFFRKRLEINESDRVIQFASSSFDASVSEYFMSLVSGAMLYIPSNQDIYDVIKIDKYISENKITIATLPPAYAGLLRDKINFSLRILITAGSESNSELIKKWGRVTNYINAYGPTESTVCTSMWNTSEFNGKNILIGKPIDNIRVYVVDVSGNLQPIGVPGELCISGDGLARGYLNNPELTAEKFVDNPFIKGERMYRTGDLARWLSDGNIEFLGRIDHQVKIRGFRIELGEIESNILTYSGVRETVVVDKEDKGGSKYLCAYIVSEYEIVIGDIRQHLLKKLPEYMVPSYFIKLASIPLTSNGKIDRKALPVPEGSINLGTEYEAPRNDVEEKLCRVWKETLGVEKIGINDNFFELGGHSLKATVLAGRIHKELEVEIPLKEIFSSPTIKGLSEYIQKSEKNIYASIDKVEEKEYYEASSAQKRMYMLQQFDLNSTAYNMPAVMEVEGKLDLQKLEFIIKALVKRHETLRTYFETIDGSIVQKINKETNFEVEYGEIYEEAQGESAAVQLEINRENKTDEIVKSFMRAFDLSKAPLLRVGLIKVQPKKYILMFDMHHIISDGISMGILINEFMELYEEKELKKLKLQYKDYSEWQNNLLKSDEMKKQEEYWLNKFSGEIPVLNLPTDYLRPSLKSFEGERINFSLSRDITKKLNKLSKDTGSTLYMLLLSALNILLSKYSGQEDIIVGSPIAGRSHADMEGIIGMFVNTLAMRNEPSGDKTYEEFLKEVRENALKAYENQDYQFEELIDKLNIARNMGRNPLFDVMFAVQNMESQDIHLNEVVFRHNKNGKETAKFDITITAVEAGEEITFDIEYCTKLFQKKTIERMSEHLRNILKSIVEDRKIRIADIEILGEQEKNKLVYEFNNSYAKYPNEKTIHELFEEQVMRTPDGIAVVFEDHKLTYIELNERSNKLARILREKGIGAGCIVGMMVERSLEMIIGIMGVLKAGGVYLPIAPDNPEDRVKYMLEDSKTNILLTQRHLLNKISFDGEVIDLLSDAAYAEDGSNLKKLDTSEDLAYIIYTSGSTGKPKGTLITNRNVIRVVKNTNYINITDEDRILQLSNYAFDGSVFDIYGALLNGGKLVMINKDIVLEYQKLAEVIEKEKITIVFLTTALFNMLIDTKIECLKNIKKVLFGGEKVSFNHVEKALRFLGKDKIIHVYGPTESTVYATYYNVNSINESLGTVPIGKPIRNTQVFILDSNYKSLQPIGVVGELCISGDGLAKGYLNNNELTLEKFIDNPILPGNRMYKTGDLARWLPDGNIEFIGRIDHQVKLRGFRIELDEIKDKLLEYPMIKEAIVLCHEEKFGAKFLCAYIVCKNEIDVKDLREKLSKSLPTYMVPSYFIQLNNMPLTPNGKIDRKALHVPEGRMNIGTEYETPRNDIEEKLCRVWEEVLGVERVGINDNFFELGGHSLKATILVSRIHKELDTQIPLKEVFSAPTIKGLGEYLQSVEKNLYASIVKAHEREYYEASSAQKRMYMLQQFDLSSTAYNMPAVMEVEGKLDFQKLEYAIKALVKRHETLRTYFETIDGRIVQKISKETSFKVEYAEIYEEALVEAAATVQLEVNRENRIDEAVRSFVRAFDLSKAPLLRVGLIKVQPEKYIIMFDVHHIISDGVSMGILISEFMKLYEGKELKELRLQYKDYSEWQNHLLKSVEMRKQEEYWLNKFSGEIPVLNMVADHPRTSVKSFEGDRIIIKLSKEITEKLNKLGRDTGSTLYMLLLSAVNILLSKYSGQEDIIVGSPIAGRSHADLEGIIGMFVNTLAMRNEPKGDKTYEEFLKEVRENALKAYENQDYQFEELVDKLNITRDMGRNPLFDVMFVLENIEMKDLHLQETEFKQYKSENKTSKFDFTIVAEEADEEIVLSIEYSTKLFVKETIERMADHLLNILNTIVQDREICLKDIELLGEEEKNKLLYEFNDTYTDYPSEKTIQELFEEQAGKTPDNIAVIFENNKLTYRELNEKSNRLSRTLKEKGIRPDSIVGLMAERSLEMIVGIMGILKAGGAYLPIDPNYPEDRVKFMLQDSETTILLTQRHLLDRISFDGEILDLHEDSTYAEDKENLDKINTSKDLAYIIYTSGSTGTPKGVMCEHKNVVRLVKNTNYIEFRNNDRILQTGSMVFDASTFEVWGALLNGLELYLVKNEIIVVPELLEKFIVDNKITILWLTSELFNQIAEEKVTLFRELRCLLVGGDVLSPKYINLLRREGSKLKIINGYGPTENTTFSATFSIEKEYESNIPIGKPIANSKAYILNENNKLLPVGVSGELCVSGDGLSRGYLNRPELTAEKFVDNPFEPGKKIYKTGDLARWLSDGNIEFIGRKDNQVKIRGFRIELGEIENRLLQHEDVKEAAVVVKENAEINKYICAYIVSKKEVSELNLREYLKENLPEYMIPAYFVGLVKMPITTNGKLDRKALPEPILNVSSIEYEAPRNEIEEKLCKLWEEVLAIDKIGINDNFFELGGHSLKATILVSRIHKELDVEIPLKEIFSTPTIKRLSKYIQNSKKSIYSSIEKAPEKEYYETSSAQRRMYMLQQYDKDSIAYNMPIVFELEGKVNQNKIEKTFKKLAERHEALRTCFETFDGEIVQKLQNNHEFKLNYRTEIRNIEETIRSFVRPFDLEKDPLFRAELVKIKEKTYLLIDMHHIISDGVSMSILIEEFIEVYSEKDLEPLKLQYKDFATWQNSFLRSEEMKKQEEYWINRFCDEIPILNMPADYERTAMQSFEGDSFSFEVNKEITFRLRKLIKETGTTMHMVLLSAFNILLSKFSGQEDIVIGTPIAGRPHADLQNIMGMFVNTLALRNKPEGDKKYVDFLKEVKENSLKAYENQGYQLEALVEKLEVRRDTSRNPLFDVMFNMVDTVSNGDIKLNDIILRPYSNGNKTSKFDLTLNALESDIKLNFTVEYCSKLFKKKTIERLSSHYVRILDSIVNNNEIKLCEVGLLSEEEKNQILYEFNDTKIDYPKDKTIQELFETHAEKIPENIAVVFEDKKLTYRELNERANSLARVLRDKGVEADSIVSIMVERSLDMIIGIMGILKAGGAYLPIDPSYPKDRIEYMLADSESMVLLSMTNLLDNIEFIGEVIDLSNEELYKGDSSNLDKIVNPNNLAYVIYTSGTTGNAKGTMVAHRSVVNTLICLSRRYPIDDKDVFLLKTPYTFDVSVTELFGWFIGGKASLAILGPNEHINLTSIINSVDKHHVTRINFVPAMLSIFNEIDEKDLYKVHSLKYLFVAGEEIKSNVVSKFYNKFNTISLENLYGPTETTIYSSMYSINKNFEYNSIPIGNPLNNTRIYIIDKNNKLLPIGVAGELCISGDGLARGYLNRPELTAEKFVENPFEPGTKMYKTGDLARWLPDGNIEFLGRIDNQVKIRGFRIELGEIENKLVQHKDVKEAAIIVRVNKENEKYICAYIVSEKALEELNLKNYLKESLPEYMVPAYFIQLERMPLNNNGKLDRKALPEPSLDIALTEYEAPRNKLEENLSKIWSEILGVEKAGINDNFFDLGGHSLKATVLISKIHKELNKEIALKEIFRYPTIKGLSSFIASAEENLYSNIEKAEEKEYYETSSAQKRMYMLQQLDKDSTAYNMPIVLELEGQIIKNRIEETFEALVSRHEVLRTKFETYNGEIIQKLQNDYKFKLVEKKENGSIDDIINKFIRPFDLEKAPLFRVELVENDKKTYLLIDMHHIISDGVSMSILINEFTTLYSGKDLESLKLQYKDFAAWQNDFLKSEKMKKQEQYWLERFNDEVPVLNLPVDYERPALQSFEGDSVSFEADEKLTEDLRKLAKETETTMHMVLLSAFNILLLKYSGQEDIVIGTPIAGRPHADLQNIMGVFINTLALRNKPEGHKKYIDFLKEVKENCLKAYENQSYQFEALVEKLGIRRRTSGNSLFNVMFNMSDTASDEDINLDGLILRQYESKNKISKFDLNLLALERDNILKLNLTYYSKIFSRETIGIITEDYITILRAISDNRDMSISNIIYKDLEQSCNFDLESNSLDEDFCF